MSNLTVYQPAALAYAPAPVDYTPEVVEAYERTMPSLLGMATGLYMLSVVTLSTASESTSWIPQVVGGALALLWIVVGLFVKGQSIAWTRPMTLFLLFSAWTTTGILVSADLDYFYSIYMTSVKVGIVTFICFQCVRTRKDFLCCCLCVGIGGMLILAFGFDTIMRALEFSGGKEIKGSRASGTLISNSNDLGQFGVLVGFAAITCFVGYKSILMRLFSIGPLIAALYIVASSGSRMAMVGIVAVAIGLYWHHFRRVGMGSAGKKIIIGFVAVAVLGGSIFYVKSLPFFFRLIAVFSSSDSMQDEPRFQYFLRAVEAFIAHPIFGLGSGGFALARLGVNYDGTGHYSHSTISETLSCNGLPGFLLYFGSRLTFFLMLRRTQQLPLSAKERSTISMLQALCYGIMIFDIVSVTFQDRLMWPLIAAACGHLWHVNRTHAEAAAVYQT